MNWSHASQIVESLRRDTSLYLPALSPRAGFSSPRVEHLLKGLRQVCPEEEDYVEIGVLEGRTLMAAASAGVGTCIGVDPCTKYGVTPNGFPPHVHFLRKAWQDLQHSDLPRPIGVLFYDGDHSLEQTRDCLLALTPRLASEAVIVVDDWDRAEVRDGAFAALSLRPAWRLLRELPEYTGGPQSPPNHTGYYYGVALIGATGAD